MTVPEILTFDDKATDDILLMLSEWRRRTYGGISSGLINEAQATGVFICLAPDGGLGAYSGTGNLPSAVCDIWRVTTPLPPATNITIESIIAIAPSTKFTERIYNALDMDIDEGTYFLAINTRHGMLIAVGGGGGSSGGAGSCPCDCIDEGDAIVNGMVTSSRWSIKMKQEIFRGEFGDIIFPGGGYTVVLNDDMTEWTLDIGDVLTAVYIDGSSATAETTMDGTLTMSWGPYGPKVELCVDGTVPDPDVD
jgi:hypothetical protein